MWIAGMVPGAAEVTLTLYGPETKKPEFPIWTSVWCIVRFSCPGHNQFATRAGPWGRLRGSEGTLVPPDELRLLPRNRFLRHCSPTLLPRSQILQPQSECYPLGTAALRSAQHLAKQAPVQMPLGQ